MLLPKVATAGKSVWMVYLLGSELGSLLRHANPYCALRPLPSFTANRLQNRALFPPFTICHPEVNDVISKLSFVDKVYKTAAFDVHTLKIHDVISTLPLLETMLEACASTL